MQLTPGDALTAGTLLVTIGGGVAVLRGSLQELVKGVRELLAGLNDQNQNSASIIKLLTDMNVKHTPEHADHSGFGTVEIKRDMKLLLQQQEIQGIQAGRDREIHKSEHDSIIEKLNTLIEK